MAPRLARLTAVALLGALVAAAPAWAQAVAGPAYVTRVVEGDTLYAELAGRIEAVRFIGVNVPRIDHPTRGREPYATAAREASRQLVEGKWIRLIFDAEPRDVYGRLLAYVWVGDLFVNAALVHRGYAEAAATTNRYNDYLRMLEQDARAEGRGLWRDPDAHTYHRPRAAETAAGAGDYEERPADATGGRVFSAPAPFIVTTPTSPTPTIAVPAAPTTPTPPPATSGSSGSSRGSGSRSSTPQR